MVTVVDIYCRSAVDEPETRAKLEAQEATCRAYCQECRLSVGNVYHEVSSGNTYRDRELLGLMRERYRTGITQGIVVTTSDRLSRSQVHLIILLQEMAAHNAGFYYVQDYGMNTTYRFVSLIVDILTEVEREKALDTLLPDSQL